MRRRLSRLRRRQVLIGYLETRRDDCAHDDVINEALTKRETPTAMAGVREVIAVTGYFSVNCPRSVFLNRASLPLVVISRRMAL